MGYVAHKKKPNRSYVSTLTFLKLMWGKYLSESSVSLSKGKLGHLLHC